MAGPLEQDFPIFPLGLVALPHEYVPLHIFEPRYRTMIAEVLERDSEFGIVWVDGEDGMRETGCAVRVTRVLEQMDDGRSNVLCQGTRPFRVVEEQPGMPYPAATVAWLEDLTEPGDPDAKQAAHGAYGGLVEQATDNPPDPDELEVMDAYAMAATVDFGHEAKQQLLELRSEAARLRMVTRLFRAATKRLEFVERAQVRAKSNGKVRFG